MLRCVRPVNVEKASYRGDALIRMRKLVMYQVSIHGCFMLDRCKRTEGVQCRNVTLTISFAPGLKDANQINVQIYGKVEYLDPKLFCDTPELIDDDQNY